MGKSNKRIFGVSPKSLGTTKEVVKIHCECAEELGAEILSVAQIRDLFPLICDPEYRIDVIGIDLDSLSNIAEYDLFSEMAALNQGYPIIVGIEIFEDFIDLPASDPVVKMPDEKSTSLGGHAVAILGYDQERQQFLFKNSFGTDWGASGYAWLTFEYARYYMFDRWVFDINDQSTQVIPPRIL